MTPQSSLKNRNPHTVNQSSPIGLKNRPSGNTDCSSSSSPEGATYRLYDTSPALYKMPRKKTSNKNTNKASKNVKSVTENHNPITEHLNSKVNENAAQTSSTLIERTEVTLSSKLIPTVAADHLAENKKYNKRKTQSNWEKYEIPYDSDQWLVEGANTRGYDFELLQNVGGGIGSHFQFKDERGWAEELNTDSDSINQLQSLDLNSLALSLSCIPFHQRLSIDPKYFKPELLFKCEAAAQLQQIKYQKKSLTQPLPSCAEVHARLPIHNDIQHREIASDKTYTASSEILKDAPEYKMPIDDELEDELDTLLALNRGKVQNMSSIDISKLTLEPENVIPTPLIAKCQLPVPEIAAVSKQSLEDWLDSALED